MKTQEISPAETELMGKIFRHDQIKKTHPPLASGSGPVCLRRLQTISKIARSPSRFWLYFTFLVFRITFSIKRFIKDLCDLGTVFELYFALGRAKYHHEAKYARNLYYEGRICDGLIFLERYRKYENDEEYIEHIMADYDDRIMQLIDMFPTFV